MTETFNNDILSPGWDLKLDIKSRNNSVPQLWVKDSEKVGVNLVL